MMDQLAWTLATCPERSIRNGDEAVSLALRAVQLAGGREPALFATLAAAYAECGRFSEAVRAAERAVAMAAQRGDAADAIAAFRSQLKLYRAGSPYRDVPIRLANDFVSTVKYGSKVETTSVARRFSCRGASGECRRFPRGMGRLRPARGGGVARLRTNAPP